MLEPEYRRVMQALDDLTYRINDVQASLRAVVDDDVRPPPGLTRKQADEWWGARTRTRGEIEGLHSALPVINQYARAVSVEYHSGRPMPKARPR